LAFNKKIGKEGTSECALAEAEEKAYSFYSRQMLYDARKDANMTQPELAKHTYTTRSYISKLENGIITPESAFHTFQVCA
jgi:ribosome-binding protein aMBF1 (putative translation factor)